MIIESIEVTKFRAINNMNLSLGKNITAIAGRNATLKTTLLGMIGQPFTISAGHCMYGCKTIDGYNFKSQFKEKFKLSNLHDHFGEHLWTLNFYNKGYYKNNKITMASIRRPTKTNPNDIRFWNAESKAAGSGYVQLPVYYLSLSRLYPIGETGKTKTVDINLTSDENALFTKYYREILCIQNSSNMTAGMEKADAKKTFIGINDDVHDVFTNSAGESNIGRIILAVLSFKRLKEEYNSKYKGGILLIDEIDATLYGYSQKKLIEFLLKKSSKYNIQVIFTTHSPIILKEINKYQRAEKKQIQNGINEANHPYNYNSSIIYLETDYKEDGERMIRGTNIYTATDLNRIVDDINLKATIVKQNINVYLEDDRAKELLIFLLEDVGKIKYSNYVNIIDVNLGWSNYVQLHKKQVPEFLNSLIILDQDVMDKKEAKANINYINENANNILFLPVDVEKGMFQLLKSHKNYGEFEKRLDGIKMSYDICFRDFTDNDYPSGEYKKWFKYIEEIIGDIRILFEFWYSHETEKANIFIDNFIKAYNIIAERLEMDYIL